MANAIQDPMDRLSTIIEGEKSPFVELSERMKETSKDIKNLNVSILDLAIALEERAGVTKDKKDKTKAEKDTDNDSVRPLFKDVKADLKDLTKGFIHGFTGAFVDFKDKISVKSEMPATVEKFNQDIDTEKKENNKVLITKNVTAENDKLEDTNSEQNKVLSDMVDALTKMRDDTTQRKLLDEAASIKKLITDQNKKTELPGGIEPNSEESKQEDREKLAEAIARKLGETMATLGIGSNLGMPMGLDLPDGPDRNKPKTPPTGKPKIPSGGAGKMGNMLKGGAGLAMLGRGITGAAVDYGLGELGVGKDAEGEDLQIDQKQDDENWNKMTIAEKMQSGLARGIEKAGSVTFLDNIAREAQADRIKNETKYFKDKKVAAPVGETDDQARLRIDRENDAREEARIEAKGGGTYVGNEKVVSGQPLSDKQMRTIDFTKSMGNSYSPEIEAQYNKQKQSSVIPEITPKKEETTGVDILNKVTDQRTDLKYDMDKPETRTMGVPIISKQTINNTEQTMVAVAPNPHSNASSLIKWQLKRSSYTDSYS